jgi:hypothetical protein
MTILHPPAYRCAEHGYQVAILRQRDRSITVLCWPCLVRERTKLLTAVTHVSGAPV